ncbi:MAG: YaaR family protein [Selenomonadaceae bacterium]|nr:YaaR family protein [Selenomonadaceae bacterium]
MAVKIGSSGAPASPFELLRGVGEHPLDKELSFETELQEQQREGGVSHEEMEAMLKKIDEQAARLTKTPTYDELKQYRMLIKDFIGTAVSNMYEVHTSAGWDRMGRQRAYTTVRKIDSKLEEMAEKIRLGQSAQLDVIASHDAIRGMLIDLFM